MSGSVDWGLVEGGVIAVAVIMLLLAPFFWWLYDTDGFVSWKNKWQPVPMLVITIDLVSRLILGDWLWACIDLVVVVIMGFVLWTPLVRSVVGRPTKP